MRAGDRPVTAFRVAAGIGAGLEDGGDGDPDAGIDTDGEPDADAVGDAAADPPATFGAAWDPHATAPASTSTPAGIRAQAGPALSLRAPCFTYVPFWAAIVGWLDAAA
jgi:hypothetical protein